MKYLSLRDIFWSGLADEFSESGVLAITREFDLFDPASVGCGLMDAAILLNQLSIVVLQSSEYWTGGIFFLKQRWKNCSR